VGRIEELIEIIGADKVEQALEAVARKQREVGDAAEGAGQKSQEAGKGIGFMEAALGKIGPAATSMIAGFVGFETLRRGFSEFLEVLQEIDRIQEKLSGGAVTFSGQSKLLAKQIGGDEAKGAEVLTRLRVAGGVDAATASELGIKAAVAFGPMGGLLAGQNLATTEQIAAFAGASGFQAQEAGQLFDLLATARTLGSPAEAQKATAKIAAAARASRASSIGGFVAQLARGGTGMLQGTSPVSLDDLLAIGGEARQAEVSEELAAQGMIDLERAATGSDEAFSLEIDKLAGAQGLDPRTMPTSQKIGIARQILRGATTQEQENGVRAMLSPERGQRLLKEFGPSNVAAAAGIGAAARGATEADFQAAVAQGANELSFREQQNAAATEYEGYVAGRKFYTAQSAKNRAEAAVEIKKATGDIRPAASFATFDELFTEDEQLRIFQEEMIGLTKAGATPEEQRQLDKAMDPAWSLWTPFWGYSNGRMQGIAEAIDQVRSNMAGRGINVTFVNTQNVAVDPGRQNIPPIPVHQ